MDSHSAIFLHLYLIGSKCNMHYTLIQNEKGNINMEGIIHMNMEQDTIYIPTNMYQYDIIHIECANNITCIPEIQHTVNYVQNLHGQTNIHVTCKMLPNVEQLLPMVQALTIRLDTPEDFDQFLHMDNHLNSHDVKDKKLQLIVQPNVEIDNCKPSDLPLLWTVIQK